jgi:hypothetical protein
MSHPDPYLAIILAAGFTAYMRKPEDKWCFYTDGERIAYAQWRDRVSVSSVHMADRTVGTGFHIAHDITPRVLSDALNCIAPSWASTAERSCVRKYASLEAFLKGYWCELVKVS